MGKEYITINGKDYRISHCFAAISMYGKLTGKNSITDMSKMDTMSPAELQTLMFCALYYGAKLDEKELDISGPEELGTLVGIPEVTQYTQIFARQMSTNLPPRPGAEVKKKNRISLWQRLKGSR